MATTSSQTGEVFDENLIREEDFSEITLHHDEIEEYVLRPIYEQITNYLKNILRGAGASVETIIFVGELCFSVYLMELIGDICKRVGTKFYTFNHKNESNGQFDTSLKGAVI